MIKEVLVGRYILFRCRYISQKRRGIMKGGKYDFPKGVGEHTFLCKTKTPDFNERKTIFLKISKIK